jgi:ABC-2 type transport system permease protein
MPEPAQWIAEALPATHFVRMIRGVVLRDASLAILPNDTLFLLLFTIGGLIVATLKFRKSLD